MTTIRIISGNAFYLETDNGLKLGIANNNAYWYKPIEGQRIIVNYTPLSGQRGEYDQMISINFIWDVLTKPIDILTEENEEEFGNDGVYIDEGWIWIGGDYLNVRFRYFIPNHYRHRVSLVENTTVENPNDGYIYLEYRYNDQDDTSNVWATSFVSFNLGKYAPSKASAEYKGLKIKINSAVNGERTLTYDFKNNGNETLIENAGENDPTEGKVE